MKVGGILFQFQDTPPGLLSIEKGTLWSPPHEKVQWRMEYD